MAGKVQPLNVSPLIKCARYSLLILGYLYGSFRLSALRIYESKARVLRHKILHDKVEKKLKEDKESAIFQLTSVAKEFEVTEFVPGWDEDI